MANALFRAGRRIKTHRQQVSEGCHSSAEHRRPYCKQDERSLPSFCTASGTRHPTPGDPLHVCREVSSTGIPTNRVLFKEEACSYYVCPQMTEMNPF